MSDLTAWLSSFLPLWALVELEGDAIEPVLLAGVR